MLTFNVIANFSNKIAYLISYDVVSHNLAKD